MEGRLAWPEGCAPLTAFMGMMLLLGAAATTGAAASAGLTVPLGATAATAAGRLDEAAAATRLLLGCCISPWLPCAAALGCLFCAAPCIRLLPRPLLLAAPLASMTGPVSTPEGPC